MRQELELLAPAGTLETLKAVIHAGADAVYFGGSRFGARAYAGNFKKEEVLQAIDFGHIHGKKIILAVNTLLKEKEVEEQLYDYLLPYYEQGLDAVIVQDFGVMQFIRENFKGLPIHTSTQMTVANEEGARFLVHQGASRIVMARELSFAEIQYIHNAVPVEIESFVHGALCYCYSGQCLLSSMLGGRSGNRGRCAQPCRLPYDVYNEKRKKISDENHSYPLSPKDLCTIGLIPQLAESGVYSFKIEGRMKQTEYAAGVVSIYRNYIDRYLNYGKKDYYVSKEDSQKLYDLGNRSGFTEGYYQSWNGPDMITFERPNHAKKDIPYIYEERKEPISGFVTVKRELPVKLTVIWREQEITVEGEVPTFAQKQPLTKEVLLSKLNKTGNTPFTFELLEIDLEDGLFLPVAAINDLRRRTLEELQQQAIRGFRRKQKATPHPLDKEPGFVQKTDIFVSASVEREEQIMPILKNSLVSLVYVDSILFSREDVVEKLAKLYDAVHNAGKQLYYILPAVFRHHTSVFYAEILAKLKTDGFLVKSYDALSFLVEHQIDPAIIRLDHNLYTYSNRTKQSFAKLGTQGDTLPLELNRRELKERDNCNSEMVLYGYLPLMTSVQCIVKNLTSCSHTKKLHYLKDRYGIFFPVKNHCSECYNVIYNSKPLYLFPFFEELKKSSICRFRLSFTVESAEDTAKILSVCDHMQKGQWESRKPVMDDFTYGHYKRGVE